MGDEDMNERDENQELYEIHYVYQEGNEDKIYYIVARSLINAIDRFYKLQPTNKIRLIRLLAERDIGRFSMKTNLTVCADRPLPEKEKFSVHPPLQKGERRGGPPCRCCRLSAAGCWLFSIPRG